MRDDRQRAIALRRQGKSYNEISKALSVPKSTLSVWFRKVRWPAHLTQRLWNKKRRKWAQAITRYNKQRGELAKERAMQERATAGKEIQRLSKSDLKFMGAALYWAEGTKTNRWMLTFVNSDPDMIRMMMRFFREVCEVPEKKFLIQLHLHPNISERRAKRFWSSVADVPIKQFGKSFFKISKASQRKRPKRTLPYGTCRVIIADVRVVNRVLGWIEALKTFRS